MVSLRGIRQLIFNEITGIFFNSPASSRSTGDNPESADLTDNRPDSFLSIGSLKTEGIRANGSENNFGLAPPQSMHSTKDLKGSMVDASTQTDKVTNQTDKVTKGILEKARKQDGLFVDMAFTVGDRCFGASRDALSTNFNYFHIATGNNGLWKQQQIFTLPCHVTEVAAYFVKFLRTTKGMIPDDLKTFENMLELLVLANEYCCPDEKLYRGFDEELCQLRDQALENLRAIEWDLKDAMYLLETGKYQVLPKDINIVSKIKSLDQLSLKDAIRLLEAGQNVFSSEDVNVVSDPMLGKMAFGDFLYMLENRKWTLLPEGIDIVPKISALWYKCTDKITQVPRFLVALYKAVQESREEQDDRIKNIEQLYGEILEYFAFYIDEINKSSLPSMAPELVANIASQNSLTINEVELAGWIKDWLVRETKYNKNFNKEKALNEKWGTGDKAESILDSIRIDHVSPDSNVRSDQFSYICDTLELMTLEDIRKRCQNAPERPQRLGGVSKKETRNVISITWHVNASNQYKSPVIRLDNGKEFFLAFAKNFDGQASGKESFYLYICLGQELYLTGVRRRLPENMYMEISIDRCGQNYHKDRVYMMTASQTHVFFTQEPLHGFYCIHCSDRPEMIRGLDLQNNDMVINLKIQRCGVL